MFISLPRRRSGTRPTSITCWSSPWRPRKDRATAPCARWGASRPPRGGLAGPRAQDRGRPHRPASPGPRRAGGHGGCEGAGRATEGPPARGAVRSRRGAHGPGDDGSGAGGRPGPRGAPAVAAARARRRAGPGGALGPHAGAHRAHDAQPAGVPALGTRHARLGPAHRAGRPAGGGFRHAGRRVALPESQPAAPAAGPDRAGVGRAGAHPVQPRRPPLPLRPDLDLLRGQCLENPQAQRGTRGTTGRTASRW